MLSSGLKYAHLFTLKLQSKILCELLAHCIINKCTTSLGGRYVRKVINPRITRIIKATLDRRTGMLDYLMSSESTINYPQLCLMEISNGKDLYCRGHVL